MRNYIKYLILLLTIVSCSSVKNKQLEIAGQIKFRLPKETLKLASEKLDPVNKLDKKVIKLKHIYKIDNVYLAMIDPFKGEVKKDFFEGHKKSFDYMYKDFGFIESQQYRSNIEKINNNDTFYMYHYEDNIGQYTFKVVNKDYTQIVGGTIVFENQSNYKEATKILNGFLKSIQFE